MRILYGVVGEGMGHATRSRVLLEHLLTLGHTVRVVVSGRAHGFLTARFQGRDRIRFEEISGLVLGFEGNAVEGETAAFEVLDDQTVSITISVTRKDPANQVVCIVRARSRDGAETGRREILVGASQAKTVQVTTTVKSYKRPFVGDIYGCGVDVPGYLLGAS